jgi:putative ABC transport system permease protein
MSSPGATLRVSISGLRAHRRRFAGTFLAVVLGVSFLAGTMLMGDTMRANFDTMFTEAGGGTDAVVRSAQVIDAGQRGGVGVREPVPATLATRIAQLPGVAAAEPQVQGAGQLVGHNGKPVGGQGPPTLAGNWITDAALNPYHLVDGRAPHSAHEAVINRGAAKAGGLHVGDTTVLRTPGPLRIRIVGIATFAGSDGMGSTTFTALTLPTAQKYLLAQHDRATSIQVRAAGSVSQRELVDRIGRVLPHGTEALTGQRAAQENQDDVAGQFVNVFTTLLLVFAGIALLVATFSIHNTFAIVVAQRTRENALLRALGASRGQVIGSTLVEAVTVGAVSSLVGVAGGIGVAFGLKALFPALGFGMPTGGLVIHTAAIAVPLAVGLTVSAASALLPAVKAGRTAPLAALREIAVDRSSASRTRAVTGTALGVAGVAMAVAGASGTPQVTLTAAGAVLVLAAFVVLGPVAATAAVRAIGSPLPRLRGVTGALARRNALRSPKRTAATATALMVGVAVVTLFTVFGASLKATLDQTVDRSFAGDVAITTDSYGAGGSGLSPALAGAVGRLPQVETAVGMGKGVAEIAGSGRELTVSDPARLTSVIDLGTVDGSLRHLGTDGIAVSHDEAAKHGWHVGSTTRLEFADGQREPFTVRAVYGHADLTGDYLITRQAWQPHRVQDYDSLVAVAFRDGIPADRGKAAVEKVAAGYGHPQVQDRHEYADTSARGINLMLSTVYALLALAVVIALLGIANTLTLAVHERTRELGLLRAVGQTRPQLRAMVRWESVLIAAFGTAGGLVLGVFLGWALVRASDSANLSAFAVPGPQLAVVLLAGVVAGALAGLRPARRAARLDVLRAVATE